jgi:hypothetical protein
MNAAEPFFCVVSRGNSNWTIEAKWPDDSIEIVESFADYFEALRWLSTQSAAWINQRVAVKDAG